MPWHRRLTGLRQPASGACLRDQLHPPVLALCASDPCAAAGHCRYDFSLSLLTKKFLQLLEESPDGVLDLNKAAETLNVRTCTPEMHPAVGLGNPGPAWLRPR